MVSDTEGEEVNLLMLSRNEFIDHLKEDNILEKSKGYAPKSEDNKSHSNLDEEGSTSTDDSSRSGSSSDSSSDSSGELSDEPKDGAPSG